MLRCQEAIGYLFRRDGLLRKALTHSSVKDEKNPSNERLEFLGDAILGMVISEYLFSMLPENDEGDLTKVKSVVVSSQTLSRLGLELGVENYLLTGKGIRMKKELPRSLVANAVEALIAAVYLDRGMEAARHWVLDHLHPYVEEVLTDSHEGKNYKSLLQQLAQKEMSTTPVYKVLSELGPDHSKSFKVSAVLGNREFPAGRGTSKKEGEQLAARIALEALKSEKGRPARRRRKAGGNGSSDDPSRGAAKTTGGRGRRKGSDRDAPRAPEDRGARPGTEDAEAPARSDSAGRGRGRRKGGRRTGRDEAAAPKSEAAPATRPERAPAANGSGADESDRKKPARRGRRRRPRAESSNGR